MKVLMIAPTPFFADRGCHVRILGEAESLTKLGHNILIVTYHLGRNPEGVAVERVLNVPWYKKLGAGPSWHKIYLDILLTLKALKVALRFRPDVLHAHLHEGALIGKVVSLAIHRPLVFDYQGSLSEESAAHNFIKKKSMLHKVFQMIEKFINILPDFTISSTKIKTGFKKLKQLPDGVSINFYDRGATQNKIPLSVLYLGVLDQYQGIDILLLATKEVVKEIPQAKFMIGGYPNVEKYQSIATSLGVEKNVAFYGKIPYEQCPAFIKKATVAVAPKLTTTEANGKILSYMACKLPVVAFESAINRQYLSDFGFYAKMGDYKDLASQIIKALKSPKDKLENIGERGYKRVVQHFSWDKTAKEIEKIYYSLSASRK